MNDQRLITPFGFASTADEVLANVDLSGNRRLSLAALASVGAAVVPAVRRPEAAERMADGITESKGNKAVTVRQLDLADQRSVTEFVDGWEGSLHDLVNNAGVMARAGVGPHTGGMGDAARHEPHGPLCADSGAP